MGSSESKPVTALGFLTVVEHEQHGLFGGYLLLNSNGRPLEFHCTAPIKPNRAQEILYGPTLQPYLCGEQIGQALIAKSQAKPLAVCTDLPAVLAARDFVSLPVALVVDPRQAQQAEDNAAPATGGKIVRIDRPHGQAEVVRFELGRNRLAVSSQHADDRAELAERLAALADRFDLTEPFDRIRNAIEEAQRTGR
ncbi:MAG: hypothetical protein B7Z73_12555 [Planctomycetia bacterium 21-64-5]|nr:MAG: hypothetical protein B7Z73_12555 [Planctomycetia bacterium 21-64-5]